MDKKELGGKIKELRKSKGWTQQELADRMNFDRTTISKWESGANQLGFPELRALGRLFDEDLSEYMLGSEERKGESYVLLKNVVVKNENAAKSVEYFGEKETFAGFSAFMEETLHYSDACRFAPESELTYCRNPEGDIENDWSMRNTFKAFVHMQTGAIVAIRDYGMYAPEPGDFLFRTEYVPIGLPDYPIRREALIEYAEEARGIFRKETESIKEAYRGKQILLLYDHMAGNDYKAWSLLENKPMYVYDYKDYRKNVFVSEIDSYTEADIKKSDRYIVVTPSREFVDALGLNLDLFIISHKLAWECWEARPEKEDKISQYLDDEDMRSSYVIALYLINTSRRIYVSEMQEVIYYLERRVYALEKLVLLGAPGIIIKNEYEFLRKQMKITYSRIKELEEGNR